MNATKEFAGLQLNHPGWVARYALNTEVAGFVWKVDAGKAGPVETSASKYNIIIYVHAAEKRPYTIEERSAVRGNGFQVWLDEYRKAWAPIHPLELVALASLSARAAETKDAPAKAEPAAIIKVSQGDHAAIMLAA